MKLPAFLFYPGDWSKDTNLKMCSIFARGLLVDLLCLMFEAKHRGRLCLPCGITPLSDVQIVDAISGSTREEKLIGLKELEKNEVLKRDSLGILHSSRLVRDEEIREERRKSGSKGGSKTQANLAANEAAKSRSSVSVSVSSSEAIISCEADRSEEIYQAYPKRQNHKVALQKIAKAVKDHGFGFILGRVQEYAKAKAGTDIQFIPAPDVWFNKGKFNDDPKTWSNGQTATQSSLYEYEKP